MGLICPDSGVDAVVAVLDMVDDGVKSRRCRIEDGEQKCKRKRSL